MLVGLSFQLNAQTITVGSGGDFANLSSAESSITAGDTVVILDQTFTDGTQFLDGVNGTSSQPVVIIAETMHQPVFQGGSEAIHLINCSYIELNGLVFEQQTSNGVNVDDGGDYSTPSTNVTIRNCIFRDIGASGNHDFLKMSGVDDFLVENCTFTTGAEGSGIDMVGCHNGYIQDCTIDDAGVTGIQSKGGTQFITIQRNIIKNMEERGLNLGGNTDAQYFRPPLPNPIVDAFEAADLNVFANIFIGNRAPIAYVGCVRVKVINNTFYKPDNWVMRILQETTTTGFLACADNEFSNNIVYLESDLTEVNTGSNTTPGSFVFTNNLWFNESSGSWTPTLPVTDPNEMIADPQFSNAVSENFTLLSGSPAIGSGQSLLGPTTDFDEAVYSSPPSVGAYEGNPSTIGINSLAEMKMVKVYPNPSSGAFNLDLGKLDGLVKMTITDVCGRVILLEKNVSGTQQVLMIDEVAGLYFLLIESEMLRETLVLVKE